MKRSRLLPALLLLSACEGTTFERAPLAAEACDPSFAGRWASVAEDPADRGEVVLVVSAECFLEVEEHERTGVRTGEGTRVHLGRHGPHRYAWVDAGWVHRRFEEPDTPPAGDVYLLRVALEGGDLRLWSTDDRPIAHRIIDDELDGEVVARDSRLFNRLTGAQDPAVLDHPGFFDAEPARFRREATPAR